MKTDSNNQKTKEVLDRGVEEVIVRESLEKKIKSGTKLRIKYGIDPTSPVIHLGNAIPLWKLRELQDLGHQAVLIVGDFTAQIGDTSDKTAPRQQLNEEQIADNLKSYKKQIAKILDMGKTEFLYNSSWLNKLSLGEVLKLASQFTVAQMIERENFTIRYKEGKPIGIQEFMYPLLQGYDSVAVKADVEIGGTDQKFNMLAGRVLQRLYGQEPQDIITLSLIEGLDGRKMSKSFGNFIGISESPDQVFGKIMSMKDELISKYFRLCTRLPLEEIKEMERLIEEEKANPRDIKARLAKEIVAIYHGKKEAEGAEREFDNIFKKNELPAILPEVKIKENSLNILDLLIKAKLAPSKSEAKRLVLQKSVEIGGALMEDWREDVAIKKGMVIKVGKRRFAKIS